MPTTVDLHLGASPAAIRAYDAMLAHLREVIALGQVDMLLSWDQETMMPPAGAAARTEHAAAVAAASHRLRIDPRLGGWLGELEAATDHLSPVARANLREARRIHDRARRVPESLATEIARATTRGQATWVAARRANRFADFAPALAGIVHLKRQAARCLAGPEDGPDDLYTALLDDFEPGIDVATLAALLEGLRPRLRRLGQRIGERVATRGNVPEPDPVPESAQMALSRRLCEVSGFDWAQGRLDCSEHPFSLPIGSTDIRITTRIRREAPWENLFATMHELGHALYNLGLDPALALTPAGTTASMGIDESQSRLWENHIGRSRAFCRWLAPRVAEAGGGPTDPDALYASVNRVEPGFIRTESDEVHYNLHILLRLEMERALIAGDLDAADVDEEWRRRFARDFGREPPDAARGALQDVHWSVGLFGYFPTYALGNLYNSAIVATMRQQLPDLDDALARGELGVPLGWLRDNVHRHGRLMTPAELIESVTGAPLGTEPLLSYLERKYTALYAL